MASSKELISAQDVEFSPSVLELMKKLEKDKNLSPLKDADNGQQAIRSSKSSPRDLLTQTASDSPTAKALKDKVQSPDVVVLPKDDDREVIGKTDSNETPNIVGSIKVDESFQKEQSIGCTPMNPWYLSNGLPSFAKKSTKRTFLEFLEPSNENVNSSSSNSNSSKTALTALVSTAETNGKTKDKVIRETSILAHAIQSESKKNQEFMNYLENIISK